MKCNLWITICLLTLANWNSKTVKAQEFTPSFTVSPKTTHKIKKDQDYTFGYLKVLENRQDPNSKTIELPVYIFKSRNSNPQKDPIIYTVGGPGSTTMPSAQYMDYYTYLDDRDFILIEQRGNYYAKPHLGCPEWSEAIYQSNLPGFDPKQSDDLFAKAVQKCRNRLTQKGIDLNGYNTNEIAADIHDLVKVLEIKTYNLLTISYSTKIAQVLLRDYPEGIRSVVMDSPLPLEVSYDEESVKNLLETVNILFSDCESDAACHEAYPNIRQRFLDYLAEKSKNPLEVQVENPKNRKVETFYLTGADLITVFTSASTDEIIRIPYEIHKLLNGDLTTVKERLGYLFQKSGNGEGKGMRLSVWCAEENPFNAQDIIKKETNQYPEVKGLSPTTFDDAICKIWSVQQVSEIENQAIQSEVPVLLISGEYDHGTPVKWAQSMMKNLPNSHHLIFKAWTHTPTTNWGNNCAMQAAHDFFNQPTVKPNPKCFDQIKKPKFNVE